MVKMTIKNQSVVLSAAQFTNIRREKWIANRVAELQADNPNVNKKLLLQIALKEARRMV